MIETDWSSAQQRLGNGGPSGRMNSRDRGEGLCLFAVVESGLLRQGV
jgi:hypothetical protein